MSSPFLTLLLIFFTPCTIVINIFCAPISSSYTETNNASSKMRVVAYLNASAGIVDDKLNASVKFQIPTESQAKYLTHLVYASALIDLNRNLSLINPEYFYYFRDQMRVRYPHVKLLISIASDQDLDFTFTMPNYPETRAIFRRNIMDFVLANNLDGVDIDWEHSLSISAKYMTQEDKSSIFTLLEELRAEFNTLPNPLLLTMITAKRPGGFFFMDEMELQKALNLVDFISVKTYGYNTHWDVFTAPSSPLFADPYSPNKNSKNVHWSMQHYGCRTAELHKLNMMIALNGYFWKSEKITTISNGTHENGGESLYRKVAVPFHSGLMEWREIEAEFGQKLNATKYNSRAGAAFLMADEKTMIIFENRKSIEAKVNYALKFGLGGVTIYSLNSDSMDTEHSLIYYAAKTITDLSTQSRPIEKYNCSIEQDVQCTLSDGECKMSSECSTSNNETVDTTNHFAAKYMLNNEKCPSAGVSDVVCCPRSSPLSNSWQNNATTTKSSTIYLILIVVAWSIIIVAIIICVYNAIFPCKNLPKFRPKLDSVNSATTISTTIQSDEEQPVQIELNLVRSERPKMDIVSTFNDLTFLNDFGTKWSEIEQNAARLTINGTTFANFKPQEEFKKICLLGKGNFSQVNKFEFRGIEIAIKQVCLFAGTEKLKRALVDLAVLGACKSPFIIQYYGYYIEQDCIQICMEPMRTCFRQILELDLQRQRGIPETAVGVVVYSMVKALEYLRSKHAIMHRDVKPSNVLLCPKGVKLCDFGISGRLNESKAYTAGIGCLAYLAPERIKSENIYDIKADVWSVGVTAVELITGKHPFEAFDEIEMLMKISHEPPNILAQSEPFSTEFTHFYRSCLNKEFQRRPNYKQLIEMNFLKLHEKIQVDVVWNWYKRLLDSKAKF